ncbi:zinc-dependent metalloprotease [Nesterenkonia sp. NBAIMH1]|uniref:zinc-dependent metalloprotease n=1 Tax=Nesterenkonia sp. NBAIMH1 TaxID=2600320 RepID=UPI0011B69A09|nr:zinc-dependent metalloprotease [Nesterenkonia sp. NBAIMH1]
MSDNSQNPGQGDSQDPEEMLRRLFGEAFPDGDKDEPDEESKTDEDSEQSGKSRGPNMGFTGTPGSGGSQGGQQNPFAGFDPSMLGGSGPFGMDPNNPMMQQIMGQVQAMFSAMQNDEGSGPVNWEVAESAALSAAAEDDPSVTPGEQHQIDSALRLADMWLNESTVFEAQSQIGQGWTRRQWIEQTSESWQRLSQPVADSTVEALSSVMREQLEENGGPQVPEELKGMIPPEALGQMTSMMERMTGMSVAGQMGQAIGKLSAEVLSGSDVGLPMAGSRAVLLPASIREFSKGLDVEDEEVMLYLALREAARIRLFTHSPWLTDDLFNAVVQFAADLRVDMTRLEEIAQGIDPQDPETLEIDLGVDLFAEHTDMQKAALRRIETTVALVEGWVDDVVGQAGAHLPSAERLREMMNRRRATGGPAEDAFAALVGLELRPQRLRDAAALWAHLRESGGIEARDEVWSHPDVQPDEADLDDPSTFYTRRKEQEQASASMDDELKKLLDDELGGEPGKDD